MSQWIMNKRLLIADDESIMTNYSYYYFVNQEIVGKRLTSLSWGSDMNPTVNIIYHLHSMLCLQKTDTEIVYTKTIKMWAKWIRNNKKKRRCRFFHETHRWGVPFVYFLSFHFFFVVKTLTVYGHILRISLHPPAKLSSWCISIYHVFPWVYTYKYIG